MFKMVEKNKQYPEYVNMKEGMRVLITQSGIVVTILFKSPTQKEVMEIQKGRINFSLVQKNNALFLLSKYGKLNWMDCIIRLQEGAVLCDLGDENQGYRCDIKLYDTGTGELKLFRIVAIDFKMSKQIKKYFMCNSVLNEEEIKEAIRNTYKNYSTQDLLKYSVVNCKIDSKF